MAAHIETVKQNYGIHRWAEGYFGINSQGHVTVCPNPDREDEIDLHLLADELHDKNLDFPVLVRFVDILQHRVRNLCRTFREVSDELGYQGGYRAIYPIKVNQQHTVVSGILSGNTACAGLEAGSKPELMAVLAQSPADGVIICNGYKDREYIRLALIGRRMGLNIYIVIEKPSELDLVMVESAQMGIDPLLGVRIRLAAVAAGNWQNSGGEKSKFGLSAGQVVAMVNRLRQSGQLHWLQLLHSHIGSQIPNLQDIRRGMGEAARFYAELRQLGVPLQVVDVGGGLGVDYEGTGTRHFCSMNYSLAAYAKGVVDTFLAVCQRHSLPHPAIFSESGRAMTAHHAVLITNVTDREPAPDGKAVEVVAGDPAELKSMLQIPARLESESVLEVYQHAVELNDSIQAAFERGDLELAVRARAEQQFKAISYAIRKRLNPAARSHRELLDHLNEQLAEKLFCNFSLFQSMPDAWAIDQIFPVMPLHRLQEEASVSALIYDLTCDSDGCIKQYVDQDGVEPTLSLHADDGEPYLLGIFLLGAYQEILGDMHNLFGDTNAVDLSLDNQGGYRLSLPEPGDSVDELLSYVHFDIKDMLASYRGKLENSDIAAEDIAGYYAEMEAGLHGYSYFED